MAEIKILGNSCCSFGPWHYVSIACAEKSLYWFFNVRSKVWSSIPCAQQICSTQGIEQCRLCSAHKIRIWKLCSAHGSVCEEYIYLYSYLWILVQIFIFVLAFFLPTQIHFYLSFFFNLNIFVFIFALFCSLQYICIHICQKI